MWDEQRAAERREALHVIKVRLGGVFTGEGKRTGVERRSVEGDAEAAGVERASAFAVVSEGRRLREGGGRSVVDAATDEQPVCGALIGFGGIIA